MRMGMVFSVVSFASLTGALIQRDNGGYSYAQVFAGSALMGGLRNTGCCEGC